ncbi:Carboxypeptidase Y [Trametes pubescens]|uniref:carboxypeptidase C n=1 Tax=Trametes pubescens TaxID=154538 RepID=A0A1M2VTQ3_TRAPU|nr:Carboxypeptidase Y [Trametes pubescens]
MTHTLAALLALTVAVSGAVSGEYPSPPPWSVLSVQESNPTTPYTEYNAELFTPVEELGALSASEFTTLSHPAFPHHSARVKQSHFCDESVRINGPNATVPFEYSWTEHANVFFIDQPVGVGFSYAEYGESVDNTIDASKDIAGFIAIFFERFTRFKGRPLHLAGKSYAVRLFGACTSANQLKMGFPGPLLACICVRDIRPERTAGGARDGLSSVMIGNGATEWMSLILSWYDARCADPIFPPVDDIADVQRYLRLPDVQAAIGVDPAVRGNFSITSWRVNLAFIAGLDLYSYRADHYLAALLERGVRVLVYVGSNDWVANWIGNDRMTRSLEWTGNGAFRAQPLWVWFVDGEAAGLTRSGSGLTFATIADAGHLAPYDQPVRSLALANRWFAREEL